MAYVYLLANAEGTLFKVGVSIVPEARMVQIGAEFDRVTSRLCVCPNKTVAYRVEKTLHKALQAYRKAAFYKSGNTEWFDISALPAALGMVEAMGEALGVQQVIDFVEFANAKERKRLSDVRQNTSNYRRRRRERWTWEDENSAHAIRRLLHLPTLMTVVAAENRRMNVLVKQMRRDDPTVHFVDSDAVSDVTAYVYAKHGTRLSEKEVKAKVRPLLRRIFGPVPATILFEKLEHGIYRGRKEYERRLYSFSDEEMTALTQQADAPPRPNGMTAPSFEIEGFA